MKGRTQNAPGKKPKKRNSSSSSEAETSSDEEFVPVKKETPA